MIELDHDLILLYSFFLLFSGPFISPQDTSILSVIRRRIKSGFISILVWWLISKKGKQSVQIVIYLQSITSSFIMYGTRIMYVIYQRARLYYTKVVCFVSRAKLILPPNVIKGKLLASTSRLDTYWA